MAQVPLGIAGPLRVNGEYAQGSFYIPLATTEGALVASYNRGMRVLDACGGVKATVVEHGRGKKVIVFKKKRRKQYKKIHGHRQDFTAVRIESVGTGSEKSE